MKNQRNAVVKYHWRQLANDSQLTRYFYKLMQKYINDCLLWHEAILFYVCQWTNTLPLHLFICIEYYDKRNKSLRFYGVSDGNAIATDGSLIGRNNSCSLQSFGANTPGSWRVKLKGLTPLNWQSSGVTLQDLSAAAKRLRLSENDPQLVYEKVSDLLLNPNNSVVTYSENIDVTEAQLNAIDVMLKRCQPDFHYKLVGNNCQNVAHDIVYMIKHPSFKPTWL